MPIKNGDKVRVHYTGKFKDGKVFDSSLDREPLEFVVGTGQLIAGFENAIRGREPGEKLTVKIDPDNGYGQPDLDLVFSVSREQVPDHIPLEVGTPLQLTSDKGNMDVTITEVGPEEITLDANHPLAGKDLEFEIEIIDAKPGREEPAGKISLKDAKS
ncbi:MAG: peptidylprolyl isomerase [Desulfovibrio sp.]|nr:peptidylprolyl isomerase [Desulfovibrio sp.]